MVHRVLAFTLVKDPSKCHHYALSVPLYTHFTSPIRRYPDIMVHRVLAFTLVKDPSKCHHYALSVPLYTHFTSPIRRYPDIMVHRDLAFTLGYEPEPAVPVKTLQKKCAHCNERKLAAKTCGELSSELFFGLFIKHCGKLETTATVMVILDHSLDILLPDYGISKRVYIENEEKIDKFVFEKDPELMDLLSSTSTSADTDGTTVKDSGATLLAIDAEPLSSDDAAWALSCAFMILTMQTGFAMLECGNVSAKNATSIMIKNCVDITLGGLSYWCFGYGLSFGADHPNWFCGIGHWFFSMPDSDPKWGTSYSHYFFHLSFASTATTIVSGAVAERMNFHAYMVFAFINTEIYCVPASWAWNTGTGWLDRVGFFDFAGVCIVHYAGGVSALVAAAMLGPRLDRFHNPDAYKMSSPVTALAGMFMLWWAWMSFNAGSTFGVQGNLWKVSAVAAVVTLNGGIAGGIAGLMISMLLHRGKVLISETINSVLGGLVAITGVCPLTSPTEALVIGAVGGTVAVFGQYLVDWWKIDDPVGAIPVHMLSAAWGTIAVGIFAKDITGHFGGFKGLIHGGGMQPVMVQACGLLAVTAWSGILTMIAMKILDMTIGIRNSADEEILGADWCHHEVKGEGWNQELLADVLSKLKDETVNEHIASRVIRQMTIQLIHTSNLRKKSAVARAKRAIISPTRTSPLPPEDQSTGAERGKSILQRRDVGLLPTLCLSRLPKTEETSCTTSRTHSGQSQREQLNAIIKEAATTLMPVQSNLVQVAGPMMLPLYRRFVALPPNDTAKAKEEDRATKSSSRSTY